MVTGILFTYGDDLSLASLMQNVSNHKAISILLWKVSISNCNMTAHFPLSIKAFHFRSCQILLPEVPPKCAVRGTCFGDLSFYYSAHLVV